MRFSVLFPSANERISPIFFQGETDLPTESVRLVNSRCPQGGHNRQKLRFDGLAVFRRMGPLARPRCVSKPSARSIWAKFDSQ